MYEHRDNERFSRSEGASSLPPRPVDTFTPRQCVDEITAQLHVEEIDTAIRNSVRCCIDSLRRGSCNPSDVVSLVSALRPLQKQPFDEDGDNTFDYCLRSVLSTYLSSDVSSPERQRGTIFAALTSALTDHIKATQDRWVADLTLSRFLASDIRLSAEEKSTLHREIILRELQRLNAPLNNINRVYESQSNKERIFDIGEVLLDILPVIEEELSSLQPPSMRGTLSYLSCWVQHLVEMDPSKLPPLEAFDNEHTHHLLGESFRFFFPKTIQYPGAVTIYDSYVATLASFFSSLVEQTQPKPSTWFLPASEAYCLVCSLNLSRDILTTSQALRRLATSPFLAPQSLLTPTSYTINNAQHPDGDFTISASQRFTYNRQSQKTVPIRDVTITQNSTVLNISFWRDDRLQTSSDMRMALDFTSPDGRISLKGLTTGGLQAYISDGPLCLPTNLNLPEQRYGDVKGTNTFQNGDYLVPITVNQLQSILRLTTEAAVYLHPSFLVSGTESSLGA